MKIPAIVISTCLLASFPAAALSQEVAPRLSGVFSSLYYNQEGGDLLGMEMVIVPAGLGGYSAFVQIAEGGEPETALVPLKVSGTRVEFDWPNSGSYSKVHFKGVLGPKEITISWPSGDVEHLKRGKSYWE